MKSRFLSAYPIGADFGLLILRLVSGGLMLAHGWMKLANVLDGNFAFADPIGLGTYTSLYLTIFAEVVCAGFLILGLFTRLALIPLMITMIVAFFVVHANDAFQMKELPLTFLGIYLALFFTGPGEISVDAKLD